MARKKATIPHRQDDRPVATLEALYHELNGELIEPKDIMGCYTPKGFVAHHIRCSLEDE